MDEFIQFCMYGVLWEYYGLVVFYKCCVGVRCSYMPFWRIGKVSESDD